MSEPLLVSQRHRVAWPTLGWVFRRVHRALAFGFGSGLIRPGSGTWGSVLALALWWPLAGMLSWGAVTVFLLVAAGAGIWICQRTVDELGVPDHVGVVWDEMVAVWIVLWALPEVLWVSALGFVLFRVFDVVKPWPIKMCDARVSGGFGVMLDDWVAALYAVVLAWMVWWTVSSSAVSG
ncbi:MAG: phosphatidylglycerophosphatase A [Burkholderiaceae bacterium]|nr:phosphatidylglycerophosphatase A [Burkholderiaceae bacterium]MCD8517316.1 phosphatidylglycerophosphatase A [Burkholderiaceae bacterium]MCD8537617.1 phosphatidylglycerophosphatase A [Burkholderiaceae bacterium]MCD8566015.1 phosphatidylglycerophosphatase A [Burkholderiaceae bacterium]